MKKTWILLSHRYNPWYNLAIEEYLLDVLQPDEFVFYLWQNQHTVVIGKHQNVWRECNVSEIENDSPELQYPYFSVRVTIVWMASLAFFAL